MMRSSFNDIHMWLWLSLFMLFYALFSTCS